MRKVTAGLFYSVDGVVESPNLWQFDSFDDEMSQEMGAMMSRVDTVLLGRVGYQEWSGYLAGHRTRRPLRRFHQPGAEVRGLSHAHR